MSTLYKVSSLIALVMNKPNMFSQVLGILNKGDQIDVISISKSWAYFKYNNINAYVKKGNLKMLNTEPIESKGSVTLKYIDITTNNEIYPSETINNLNLGKYSYEAKVIYNYKLQSNSIQSVNLTEEYPDQVIIFYYNKILGSITIKYIDKNVNTDIYEPKVIENLSLGTYTYGAINISGYVLSDNEIKTVTITETSPNATITFKYAEILGTVTIRYIDNSSYTELSEADTFTDLKLGTYSYNYKNIPGYSLANDSTQTVELTDDNHDVEIEFKYNELLGSVTIKYIDSSSLNEIETATVISNLSLGTYSYSAKSFEGYEIIGDSSQSVTLNDSNLNAIISFNYSRISGSITIKYLDSSTLSEIAPSITISNIALGSYTYDTIYIDNYEIDGDSSISTTLTVSNPNQTISFKYNKIEIPDDLNWNEVPYISTYYIKPVVKPGEEVFIDYYITDYYQKEYIEEDYSETFTVTVRVEGQNDKLYHYLKAGDHKVSLGSFNNEGEQKFSILCTDKYGRNSHELFNFFLVQSDIQIKEYIMTEEDLRTYNIKNTDNYEVKKIVNLSSLANKNSTTVKAALLETATNIIPESKTYVCVIADTDGDGAHNNWWEENQVVYANDYNKDEVLREATNTRIGLQQILDDKKSQGYNKIKLLNGIYRIDHQKQIYIPTKFTLDLNGATIKQNQFTGNSSLMFEINNAFDSHLINGTIDGDYFSHDYINSPNSSEWASKAFMLGGECKYCSCENLIINNITGYASTTGISNSRDNSLGYTTVCPITVGDTFSLGDIDRKTGLDIASTIRTTSSFINIGIHYKIGYLSISRYLGYQGRAFNSWNLICHFYDENKAFIKSVDAYQYRRIRVPNNSRYIRITTTTKEKPIDLYIHHFRIPTHCTIKNIKYTNCRSVALAPAAMNNILVENCEFINSGQSLTNCAFDAEDGWDMMQDCTFRRLNFHDNPKNEWLAAAGHNFIIENMIQGKVYFYPRCNSYVLKNCNSIIISRLGRGDRVVTGYTRITNNHIYYSGNLEANYAEWPSILKDCTINGTAEALGNYKKGCIWLRCDIGESTNKSSLYTTGILPGIFIDCYIHDKYGYNLNDSFGYYKNCIIRNIKGGFSNNLNITDSQISDITLNLIRADIISLSLVNCKITNFTFDATADYIKNLGINVFIDNCIINNSNPILMLLYYLTNKPILLSNNIINSASQNGLITLSGYDNNDNTKNGPIENRSIKLLSNTINLTKSNYIINGLSINSNTKSNTLKIFSENNILNPDSLLLFNMNVENSLTIISS